MWRDTSLKVSRHILPYSGRTSGISCTYPKLRMRKNIVIGSPKGRFLRFFFDEFAIQIQTSIIHLKFNLSRSVHNDSRTFMNLSPTFLKLSPTFLGKSPTFFGKRPMFLLDAWRSMNLTSEECFIVLQIFVFSTSLARARARTPYIFALFAFTTFTKMGVVYWNTTPCESIRNGVLQKCMKVRPVEAMKGVVFGGEIVWFASHFYENSTPIGEGCESKKCMFAGNARAYARKLTLYFSSFEVSRLYRRG